MFLNIYDRLYFSIIPRSLIQLLYLSQNVDSKRNSIIIYTSIIYQVLFNIVYMMREKTHHVDMYILLFTFYF